MNVLAEVETNTDAGYNKEERVGPLTTKIHRYGWRLKDQPGRFLEIAKADLYVDPDYQRSASATKVNAIAAEWSWVACGAIIVTERDGKWYVIDGQHRVLGARRRSDVRMLPCVVFETAGPEQEAAGFLNSNLLRKPMDMVDKFRALIITRDPVALKVLALIEDSGREIGRNSGPTMVTCLAAMMLSMKIYEGPTRRVWPVILELCEGFPVHGNIFSGLTYLEAKLEGTGCSMTKAPWRGKLMHVGYERVLAATQKAAAFYTKGGPRVWASGIVEVVNHGMRTNRLSFDE